MLVCYVFHFLCAHPAWQRDPNSSLGLGGRSFQRVPSFPLACLLGRARLRDFSNCPGKFYDSDTESVLGAYQSHCYNLHFILYFLLFESTVDGGGIASGVFPGPTPGLLLRHFVSSLASLIRATEG